jgi:hypothetical protein
MLMLLGFPPNAPEGIAIGLVFANTIDAAALVALIATVPDLVNEEEGPKVMVLLDTPKEPVELPLSAKVPFT